MRGFAVTLALVSLSISASTAMACTVTAVNEGWKKLTVESDCAFRNAGHGRHYSFKGEPVVDFGNGRVGQRLINGALCHSRQNLFFMDCSIGEAVVIVGKRVGPLEVSEENVSPETGRKTVSTLTDDQGANDLILEPLGPVRLSAQITVTDVKDLAKKYNYRATSNIDRFFHEHARYKRYDYDYTCGCKLYYPDSPGAKL